MEHESSSCFTPEEQLVATCRSILDQSEILLPYVLHYALSQLIILHESHGVFDANPFWRVLFQYYTTLPLPARHHLLERFMDLFPTAYDYAAFALEKEIDLQDFRFVRKVLRSVLTRSHNYNVHSLYLRLLKETGATLDVRMKARQMVLEKVGLDLRSLPLWREEISDLVRANEISCARELFHDCLVTPRYGQPCLLSEYFDLERMVSEGHKRAVSDQVRRSHKFSLGILHVLTILYEDLHGTRNTGEITLSPLPAAWGDKQILHRNSSTNRTHIRALEQFRQILRFEFQYPLLDVDATTCFPLNGEPSSRRGPSQRKRISRIRYAFEQFSERFPQMELVWLERFLFEWNLSENSECRAVLDRLVQSCDRSTGIALALSRLYHSTHVTVDVSSATDHEEKLNLSLLKTGVENANHYIALRLMLHQPSHSMQETAERIKAHVLGLLREKRASWRLMLFMVEVELKMTKNVGVALKMLQMAERQFGMFDGATAFLHGIIDIMMKISTIPDTSALIERSVQQYSAIEQRHCSQSAGKFSLWGRYMEILRRYTPLWLMPGFESRMLAAIQHSNPSLASLSSGEGMDQAVLFSASQGYLNAIVRYSLCNGILRTISDTQHAHAHAMKHVSLATSIQISTPLNLAEHALHFQKEGLRTTPLGGRQELLDSTGFRRVPFVDLHSHSTNGAKGAKHSPIGTMFPRVEAEPMLAHLHPFTPPIQEKNSPSQVRKLVDKFHSPTVTWDLHSRVLREGDSNAYTRCAHPKSSVGNDNQSFIEGAPFFLAAKKKTLPKFLQKLLDSVQTCDLGDTFAYLPTPSYVIHTLLSRQSPPLPKATMKYRPYEEDNIITQRYKLKDPLLYSTDSCSNL